MNQIAPFSRMPFQHLDLGNLTRYGDHLRLEHPTIDAQHRAIFDLGLQVYEDWSEGGSLDVLRPAVEKLSNLVHSHFAYEERLLHEIDYDDLKNHAAEHQALRDELSILHDRLHGLDECRRTSLVARGDDVIQFILGLTVGHVGSSDMRYYRALRANRGLVPDGEPSASLESSSPSDPNPNPHDPAAGVGHFECEGVGDFWRGANALYLPDPESGPAAAARSAARLQARLQRRAGRG